MITIDFLSQLKRFSLIVNKRVTSSFSGGRRSIAVGRGLVISDFRQYVPGDDYRTIDWRIFARTDDFFVKRFEEERNLTVHVLIDVSKSMDYGTGKHTKFEYATMLGLGFAYLAARSNEKFTLSTFSKDITTFRAKRGMSQVVGFLHHLNHVKCSGVADFSEMLKRYKKSIKSKSLVIVISDLLFNVDEIKESLYQFKQHELKLIQVLDRSEIDFTMSGSVILKDSETNKEKEIYVSERLKKEYRKKLYDHMIQVEDECARAGGEYYLFSTEEPLFDAFYRMVNQTTV